MLATLRRLVARTVALFRRERLDDDFRNEAASHLAMMTDENIRRGMSPESARRHAMLRFGGVASLAEQHREHRGLPRLDSIWQDMTYAARTWRRSPMFFAGIVLTLALGVGVNGAVFGILRAVLLQPLPYAQPDRLMTLLVKPQPKPQTPPGAFKFSQALSGDLAQRIHRAGIDAFEPAAYVLWRGNLEARFDLSLADRTERLRGAFVTPNFFSILGVSASLGRVFGETDTADESSLLVVSDALWRRDFGADPSAVGKSVTLVVGFPRRSQTFRLIGVLPRKVKFSYPDETEAWTTMPWADVKGKGSGFSVIGRLRSVGENAVAGAGLTTLVGGPPVAPDNFSYDVKLEPLQETVTASARPSMFLLGGLSALLLLIACTAVANALLVRFTARKQELAVREAIGAGRGRLVQQLLVEGFLLSAIGAVSGALLATLAAPLLRALVPSSLPRGDEIDVTTGIVGFLAAAGGLTVMVSAVMPAWWGAHANLSESLKRSTLASDQGRRGLLVGAQAAIATTLLLAASLLLVSFWRLNRMPLGFERDRIVTVELNPTADRYRLTRIGDSITSPALRQFQQDIVERLGALPGVISAGTTSAVPFRGTDFLRHFHGMTDSQLDVAANQRYVDAGYFSVFNVPLLRGRLFDRRDIAESAPVVVISGAFARQMFGDEDPIGKFVNPERPLEVIGVVGELRYQGFDREPLPAVYLSNNQQQTLLVCVVARVATGTPNLEAEIRAAAKAIDPTLPVEKYATIDQVIDGSVADRRFVAAATATLAILALVLTVVSLAVVIARAVVERRREAAIRSALGASARQLTASVLVPGLMPVAVGIVIGLVVVAAGAATLQQFLFHVAPRSPWLYAVVGGLVFAVSFLAALIPALQAVRVKTALLTSSSSSAC